MPAMGRRGFLTGAFLNRSAAPAPEAQGSEGAEGASRAHSGLIPIGGIADFPIGSVRFLPEAGAIVESLPEGLRARSPEEGGPHFAIHAGPHGGLVVDLGRNWPANRVYSVLTNESADINTSWEETT